MAEVVTPDEPPDRQFQSLGEPLFELPLSGWYWQITRTDTEKAETRASRSLWDKKLPKLEEQGAELTAAGIRIGYVDGPEGQSMRMVERPVGLGAHRKDEAAAHRGDSFASKVLEQADVMRDQVAHHLERARIAARVTVVGTVTEVAPAIEALRRTMEKIHRDRGIVIEVREDARARFRGERQDIEEMVGNLVDNACKWAA